MHKLYDLKEKLCKQLEEYADKELTPSSLDVVDTLAHATKNLDKIIEKYEEKEYGNSYGSMDYGASYGNYYGIRNNRMMPRTMSYARGRSNRMDSMDGYSRGGYSRNNDIIMDLNDLMNDAPDERSRMEIQKCIQSIQGM